MDENQKKVYYRHRRMKRALLERLKFEKTFMRALRLRLNSREVKVRNLLSLLKEREIIRIDADDKDRPFVSVTTGKRYTYEGLKNIGLPVFIDCGDEPLDRVVKRYAEILEAYY